MNTKRKIWLSIFFLLVIGAAGGAFFHFRGDDSIEVTLGKVQRGDITSIVTATGKVKPESEVRISSEVPGEITALPVKDGNYVEKGDLLASVNPDTLEAQVQQQEASLSSIKSNSAQAKAEMLQAELDLKRIRELHEKGFSSEDQLDQAKTTLEVRRAAYQASLHQIERQEMQLMEARESLEKTSVYSPISGTVTRLNLELGDRVVGTGQFEGTEIMRVANLDNMEVRVQVSETDIINVSLEDPAVIEIDSFPDTEFKGKVSQIANSADTENANSQEELTTFEVRIALEKTDQEVRPGMTATADIETETVTDVVKVPLGSVVIRQQREIDEALNTSSSKKENSDSSSGNASEVEPRSDSKRAGNKNGNSRVEVIFVNDNGIARLQPVTIGIADSRNIEIKSGLDKGQSIVTGSYRVLTRELNHGDAIREREAPDFRSFNR